MAARAAERNGMQSNNKRPVPAVLSASVLSAWKLSARKQARKKSSARDSAAAAAAAGRQMGKHHASEGQRRPKITPRKCLT